MLTCDIPWFTVSQVSFQPDGQAFGMPCFRPTWQTPHLTWCGGSGQIPSSHEGCLSCAESIAHSDGLQSAGAPAESCQAALRPHRHLLPIHCSPHGCCPPGLLLHALQHVALMRWHHFVTVASTALAVMIVPPLKRRFLRWTMQALSLIPSFVARCGWYCQPFGTLGSTSPDNYFLSGPMMTVGTVCASEGGHSMLHRASGV